MPMQKVKTTAHGRSMDRERKALPPGVRTKADGTKYTERRSNRSDTADRHY